MTAFDVVHDRLDGAVSALADAHIAHREHSKAKPLRQVYRFGDDPVGEALINAEQHALVRVVAAYHYAEQVSARDFSGESTLDFLERERREAVSAEPLSLTINRDPSKGLTRLEQLGTLYHEEQERAQTHAKSKKLKTKPAPLVPRTISG